MAFSCQLKHVIPIFIQLQKSPKQRKTQIFSHQSRPTFNSYTCIVFKFVFSGYDLHYSQHKKSEAHKTGGGPAPPPLTDVWRLKTWSSVRTVGGRFAEVIPGEELISPASEMDFRWCTLPDNQQLNNLLLVIDGVICLVEYSAASTDLHQGFILGDGTPDICVSTGEWWDHQEGWCWELMTL